MKIIRLLLPIGVLLFLSSCESEYTIQLGKAKELVRQEQQLLHTIPGSGAEALGRQHALSTLREDIAFHAHMSGNEEVFARELDGYRAHLEGAIEDPEMLITKYP